MVEILIEKEVYGLDRELNAFGFILCCGGSFSKDVDLRDLAGHISKLRKLGITEVKLKF